MRRFGLRSAVLLAATLVAFGAKAWPQGADLSLRQLNHRAFTVQDGAPTDIAAIAQTPDGTLWIGGHAGLTRFDGARFVPYPAASEEPLQALNIASLLATPDGDLWIGFRLGGIALLRGGRITRFTERDGVPRGTVAQFAVDRDGSVWAAVREGLAHLERKRWELFASDAEIGSPYGVLVDRTGTLWVATVDGLFARAVGEHRLRDVDVRSYADPGGILLTGSPDGRIWAAAQRELIRVDRPADPRALGVATAHGISGGPLLFDRAGNLWASGVEGRNLLRVPARELIRPGAYDVRAQAEEFSRTDVANPGRVTSVLEDREGNVWVGTATGLHRFSHSNVVRDATPRCLQYGFTAAAFVAGEAGSLWVVCGDGSVTHLDEMRNGVLVSRQDGPDFTVAYRDREGTVWFGGPSGIGRLEGGRVVMTALPSEVDRRPIQALLRDDRGGMWVSVTRRGTYRVVKGAWSENDNLAALPRAMAYVLTAGQTGTLWFGYSDNRVARVEGRVVRVFDATQGLDVGNVMSILVEDRVIWVGGELGFARFDGMRFVPVRSASGAPFRGVSGIVRARNGDLWLNGINGIAHIAHPEVERILRDSTHRVVSEIFDYLDGVPGTAVQLRPQPSAIETTDGRIWFSTTGGVISIDPTQLVRNTLPPPVTIWSLSSGDKRYSNLGADLQLPVHTTDLRIDYSAGSLTVPERVRFRYKLEGTDADWQDAGARREVRYTNLDPGRYTFRVTASNNDGVWNDTGASMAFSIAPAFYQTAWFYALCGLVGVAILGALYRVRVRQVAAQVRGRLEARLAERERIARNLHDTLLQGMQGLIWRFQAASDRMAPGEPARQLMEQSLDRADQLLAESRDKVKELRPAASDAADLPHALAAAGEQFAQVHPAKFRVSVLGTARDLHPIVREEGFLIAREALSNAFQHARAADIEAEVTYDDAALHIRIRDDGQGISSDIRDAGGKPGHFGLLGMRERATRLGAHLQVWSKPGAGTEVDLRVPAEVAYRRSRPVSRRARSWLALFRSAATEH